jgi:phosphatidylserine decarboxylase
MMRDWFFMRTKWVRLSWLMVVISLWYIPAPWKILAFATCVFWLWLHRRRFNVAGEHNRSESRILLSPADGQIISIKAGSHPADGLAVTEIRIRMNHWGYWGLHLPASAEMAYLKEFHGPSFARSKLADLPSFDEGHARTDVHLKTADGVVTRLRFFHCTTGRSPRTWMKSGDFGKEAACFGHYPFGGSLVVFVPQPSDILVVEHEKITAGQTVLAALRL